MTFETSKCGSHKTKPRPIMSMAALRRADLAVGVVLRTTEAEVGVATELESALLLLDF